MQQYHEILEQIASQGSRKGDRTGTGTTSWFGQHKRFDLHHKFQPRLPVVTTKKIHLPSIEHELFWMLSGDTRLEYLIENGVRIWNEWVKPGTEVYRDLTVEEITTHLEKHWTDNIKFVNSETPYMQDWDEDNNSTLYISVKHYRESKVIPDETLILEGRHGELHHNHLKTVYQILEHKPAQKLIGGDLGPVYGKTWRDIEDIRIVPKLDWPVYEDRKFDFVVDLPGEDYTTDRCVIQRKVDQVAEVLHLLEKEPDSRRIIICAWDPRLVEDQALPPCHAFIQFWTRELTAEERLEKYTDMEDQRIQDQIESGVMERGQGVPSSVDSFIACMDVFSNKRSTLEDYHIRMDKEGVPRRAISCQLYQR